mgnify:CR=1 FL=1
MGLSAKQLLKTELIGRTVEIVSAKNKTLLGIKAKIIDETKNALIILHAGKRKMILKNHVKMVIEFGNKKVLVDGKQLAKRPEERTGMKI